MSIAKLTIREELRLTMPWTHKVLKGGVIKVLDKHGVEVPMSDMLTVLEVTTARLAKA